MFINFGYGLMTTHVNENGDISRKLLGDTYRQKHIADEACEKMILFYEKNPLTLDLLVSVVCLNNISNVSTTEEPAKSKDERLNDLLTKFGL